jgi:hypothetical protein
MIVRERKVAKSERAPFNNLALKSSDKFVIDVQNLRRPNRAAGIHILSGLPRAKLSRVSRGLSA